MCPETGRTGRIGGTDRPTTPPYEYTAERLKTHTRYRYQISASVSGARSVRDFVLPRRAHRDRKPSLPPTRLSASAPTVTCWPQHDSLRRRQRRAKRLQPHYSLKATQSSFGEGQHLQMRTANRASDTTGATAVVLNTTILPERYNRRYC